VLSATEKAGGEERRWDRLVQLIYESAHDDARTPEFLDALVRATHSSSTSVLVQDPISNRGIMDLNSYGDEAYARAQGA
jgi:hypothetical protein